MKRIIAVMLSIAFAGSVIAAQAQQDTATATTTKTAKRKPAAKKSGPNISEQLSEMKTALDAQQQQIKQLSDLVETREQKIQQLEQRLDQSQAVATQAQTKADTVAAQSAEEQQTVMALKSDVTDLKTGATSTALDLQETQKTVKTGFENPVALHYKGVTLTPGGFVAAYGIYRSHNTSSDATSTFGGIPFSGTSNAHLSEFRLTERHSNISLMADSNVHGIQTKAYFEMDFEGAAPTANETISNSFTPRVREFWVNAETKNGLAFLAGQGWELLTPNRKSIAPKTEFRPATIDASYLVGYHYARETMFRITDRVSDKVTFAAAVENPETVIQGSGAPANCSTGTANCIVPGVQGTGFAAVTSTDIAPDVAVKVAFDPGWGHYELGGIARFYRSRFVTTTDSPDGGTNNTNVSGAFAFNAILPLVPKKIDFYLTSLAGRGVGRFLPGGGVDVIVKPDGTLMPVRAAGVMGGFEIHPTPSWDINLYGGNEYYSRTIYLNATGGQVGYGRTTANQTNCSVEVPSSSTACEANNRDIWEITPQVWRRFWKGKEGTLQWGLEYEYIHRKAWAGNVGTSTFQPSGIQNVFMTAMRWYLP